MRVDAFDFDLPEALIALRPVVPRDAARCLVVRGSALEDRHMRDLPELLDQGDLLVFNDTRVIPAALAGVRQRAGSGTARIHLNLHKRLSAAAWRAFARPQRRLRVNDTIIFAEGFQAQVSKIGAAGEISLDFNRSGRALDAAIEANGMTPLPPYIGQRRKVDARDAEDYQAIFARMQGSVAAPTASLHFTDTLLATLQARGVGHSFVTLHVGAGTFLPVKAPDTDTHHMHSEWGMLPASTADLINRTRAAGKRVVAAGTTALRLIETAASPDGGVTPWTGETDIFITPGYRFRAVDALITNFHLPRSTLFMLVSAFCGLERMKTVYAHAMASQYRFYSYGDGSLLFRAPA